MPRKKKDCSADWRSPDERKADEKLEGTWYRCKVHGQRNADDGAIIILGYAYCSEAECDERLMLVHSAARYEHTGRWGDPPLRPSQRFGQARNQDTAQAIQLGATKALEEAMDEIEPGQDPVADLLVHTEPVVPQDVEPQDAPQDAEPVQVAETTPEEAQDAPDAPQEAQEAVPEPEFPPIRPRRLTSTEEVVEFFKANPSGRRSACVDHLMNVCGFAHDTSRKAVENARKRGLIFRVSRGRYKAAEHVTPRARGGIQTVRRTPGGIKSVYRCAFCGSQFDDASSLVAHMPGCGCSVRNREEPAVSTETAPSDDSVPLTDHSVERYFKAETDRSLWKLEELTAALNELTAAFDAARDAVDAIDIAYRAWKKYMEFRQSRQS